MATALTILLASPVFGFAASSQQDFRFRDVTFEAGLLYPIEAKGMGIAVGDYDNDGWQDIVIAGGKDTSPQIFRNQGGRIARGEALRSFANVTSTIMPADAEPSGLCMLADLDSDGDQDLVSIRRYRDANFPLGNPTDTGLEFYEWRQDRFRRVQTAPDLARAQRKAGGLALGDTDLDGDLDIVFVHNGGAGSGGQGGPGHFIRNDGLERLVDATAAFGAGLGDSTRYFSVLVADFNRDGWPDVHAAVDFYSDWHCWNTGGNSFVDVTTQVGTTHTGSDMGLAIGDIENDGDLDIYSTNIASAILYVNDGTGHFSEEGSARGCGAWGASSATGWGAAFADLDHDRDQDLVFVANGDPGFLFENDGAGYFDRATEGTHLRLYGHALIPFDYDRDGDLDLLIGRHGPDPLSLYENRSPALSGRHWLRVQLRGNASNREGVGARVEVLAGGVMQTREILAGYSFRSGPPSEAHFGLGDAAGADLIRVTWPSGSITTLHNVSGDRLLMVGE